MVAINVVRGSRRHLVLPWRDRGDASTDAEHPGAGDFAKSGAGNFARQIPRGAQPCGGLRNADGRTQSSANPLPPGQAISFAARARPGRLSDLS